MAKNKIHVSIVTPEKNYFEGKTDFVLVPALDGAMGILPDHMPLVTRLSTGIAKIGKTNDIRYFALRGGYIEVLFNRVIILTDRVIEAKYEDKDMVLKELKKKYKIVQKVTEDTKKVAHAITHVRGLKN